MNIPKSTLKFDMILQLIIILLGLFLVCWLGVEAFALLGLVLGFEQVVSGLLLCIIYKNRNRLIYLLSVILFFTIFYFIGDIEMTRNSSFLYATFIAAWYLALTINDFNKASNKNTIPTSNIDDNLLDSDFNTLNQ
jgi:hypothetical protein